MFLFSNRTLKPRMMRDADFTPAVRVGLCMIPRDYDGETKALLPRWTTSYQAWQLGFCGVAVGRREILMVR